MSSSSGIVKTYNVCRFCSSEKINTFLDLGNIPLAGGFMKSEDEVKNELTYPLRLYFCEDCKIVSVKDIVPGNVIFNGFNYYTSSSIKTLVDHSKEYAKVIRSNLWKGGRVLEIGCNDGVLLKPLRDEGLLPFGIDPSTNAINKLKGEECIVAINDFFTYKKADELLGKYGKFDCITSSNTFAHIEDMNDVMKGIDLLLQDDGLLLIEVHYLLSVIEGLQYDMIYHEHMSYYSINALGNFMYMKGFRIVKVELIPVHGGSIRVYCRKINHYNGNIDDSVPSFYTKERKLGIYDLSYYTKFFDRISTLKTDLLSLLSKLKSEGKVVYGYGACGRGTITTSFCGLTKEYLSGIVDDSLVKIGAITPYNHLKIESSDLLRDGSVKPDYCLLFCWSFIDEVKKKHSKYEGKFILPIPEVKIV